MKKLTLLVAALSMVGCAKGVYIQEGIVDEQSTTHSNVTTDSIANHKILYGLNKVIVFDAVDGVSLWNISYKYGAPQALKVLPGIHRMTVRYNHGGAIASSCIEFESVAGKNYIVKKHSKGIKVTFWLENESGEVVGSSCNNESSEA